MQKVSNFNQSFTVFPFFAVLSSSPVSSSSSSGSFSETRPDSILSYLLYLASRSLANLPRGTSRMVKTQKKLAIHPKPMQTIQRYLNSLIGSPTTRNRMRAVPSTVMLADDVKPFLLLDNLSLILFDWVSEFTIDMFAIYTEAQPILNKAGRVMYQACQKLVFVTYLTPSLNIGKPFSSRTGSLTNDGKMKIPKNVGMTKSVPNIYHGVLYPHGELNLSLSIPTNGVISPSANYPDRTAAAPTVQSTFTTSIRQYVRYTNHILAHKSLLK